MSSTPKRPDKKAASSWIQGGEDHQPKHQARMLEAKAKVKATESAAVRGGRPKSFEEETERLNVMLPASMVRFVKQKALDGKETPGQVLAAIIAPVMKREK
jgi:hypothetical protein